MRNSFFHAENAKQKRVKMRQIIHHRAKNIKADDLDRILDAIDYDRQYFVKITSKPQKFKNIVVNEIIKNSDNDIHSESFRIYGNFTSGLYQKTETGLVSKPSELNESKPAAALKYTKIVSANSIRSTHEIVIYQPM